MRQRTKDRVERARTLYWDFFVKSDDPYVVEVESDSGNEYTIVPNVAYCSCPDRQYRDNPCKHLIRLGLVTDGELQDAVVSGFRDEADRRIGDLEKLDEKDAESREMTAVWFDAFDVLDANRAIENVQDRFSESEDTERVPDHTGYLPASTALEAETDDTESETDEITRIASTARVEED